MNGATIRIGERFIGEGHPTYFIADIAANHDGDLERAKPLIHLAAEAGADAAKFQNFRAASIVSDVGFRQLGGQTITPGDLEEVRLRDLCRASIPLDWTPILVETCLQARVDYFTSPYDLGAVDRARAVHARDQDWLRGCDMAGDHSTHRVEVQARPCLLPVPPTSATFSAPWMPFGSHRPDRADAMQHELHGQSGEPPAREPQRATDIRRRCFQTLCSGCRTTRRATRRSSGLLPSARGPSRST